MQADTHAGTPVGVPAGTPAGTPAAAAVGGAAAWGRPLPLWRGTREACARHRTRAAFGMVLHELQHGGGADLPQGAAALAAGAPWLA